MVNVGLDLHLSVGTRFCEISVTCCLLHCLFMQFDFL